MGLKYKEIPVYRGEKYPLEGNFLNSEEVHGKDGLAENDLNGSY
ncbi:MAG: hypothetical protein BAJALOKI1v1_740001 [Promethearchaeota archaeon]|nr:MAG: hypothetical protein BAJALOKI1v1_740001 [Candidatus Lokiarchaeota archaeon]